MNQLITELATIASDALLKEEENDHFLQFIQRKDSRQLDTLVHHLNNEVSNAIDCTQCGNCCKTLMINITPDEVTTLANHLQRNVADVKAQYIEESLAGNYIINTIPCHFLANNRCTIYAHRFAECSAFPHLHKDGFKERLAATLMYYGSCPIIYNVIEAVKKETGFMLET
ncbi:MAG TPA: YkgJ family cysteine cluster protein [Flavipsychrobacter sp.]|nr:YkgJ family cysteine cluster protein [Flavipsychrobacter sp.]